MKFAVAFVAVFYFSNRADWVSGSSVVETKWMRQKLDNFNTSNEATWNMRYMVYEKYFKTNGPIFLLIGGEFPIARTFIYQYSLFTKMAAENGGILFSTEHRFYGESKVGTSLAMETLQFLTAPQALEDLANFIRTQRATDPRLANSKVIISGCSYAGSLAVWLSRLHPELVDGAWALSAPLLAKAEFPEFMEITGKAIKDLGSPECYDRIQRGVKELENMFFGGRAKEAVEMLKLCNFDHANEKDIWAFFRQLQNMFSQLVSYNNLQKNDIGKCCDFLMASPDDLSAIVSYFLKNYEAVRGDCRFADYQGSVFYDRQTSYDSSINRQWRFQVCNEFGWFFGTNSSRQPFGKSSPITLDWYQCYDIYGADFTEERIRQKIAKTNELFGGLNPNVKNTIVIFGDLDPWSALGPGDSEISIIVHWYSHCPCLSDVNEQIDTSEMVETKRFLLEKVREWLA